VPCSSGGGAEITISMGTRPPLGRLVSKSRYLMLAGILGLIAGAMEACFWSAGNAYRVLRALLRHEHYTSGVVGLLHMLDAFLVAAVLILVAIGTYGLFIEPLKDAPEGLVVRNLGALKVRFASILILLMTVAFVEHILSWDDPWNTLVFGGAIALVSLTLIGYSRWAAD
jgi:uncharacterized membrane protein YqhA